MTYLKRCGAAGLHPAHDHETEVGTARCDGLSNYLLQVGTAEDGDVQDLDYERGMYAEEVTR